VNSLDVVAPQWITITDPAGDVEVANDPEAVAVIASASIRPRSSRWCTTSITAPLIQPSPMA